MLSCDSVMCERGGRAVLAGIGFSLPPGGFLLLKGSNGSGKTTLIRALAGLSAPSAGSICWHGVPVQQNAEYQRELTYIGHQQAVKLHETVTENLAFWGALHGTQTLVPAARHYYGLEPMADTLCGELSAGWQRRVALARLIVAPGRVWLLDEPTNFLDEEAVLLTNSLIETRLNQGGIVVVASHAMQSAYATHTLQLKDFGVCGS